MQLIIGFVALIILVALVYNNLISKVNQIKNAQGSLDACLKQRYDLIPNLIEVAKQYMDHEEKMFTKIIELRSSAIKSRNMTETINSNKELDQALKGLMVNVENYPTLLSNQNFTKIQDALIDLEANIAAARRFYNTAVVSYNESIQMIPGKWFAPTMGLVEQEIYSIPEIERKNPNVKELFKR